MALQCALLPRRDTPVLAQVPALVAWQSAPRTLLRLASTPTGTPHQGTIPMGTPRRAIIPMGTMVTIRSTIRRSTASTTEAR